MKRMIIVLFALFLLSGCTHQPPFHQSVENIVSIDLVSQSNGDREVLCTLRDEEIEQFMQQLDTLECHKRNPPGWESCILEIQLHYSNGDMDAIGTSEGGNSHVIQGNFSRPGWYYYDTDDLYALFACYVDKSVLPSTGMEANK